MAIAGTLEEVSHLSITTSDTGEVIAVGSFDKGTNTSKFIFTDYIKSHDNVTAEMAGVVFVDHFKLTKDETNTFFKITIAGQEI